MIRTPLLFPFLIPVPFTRFHLQVGDPVLRLCQKILPPVHKPQRLPPVIRSALIHQELPEVFCASFLKTVFWQDQKAEEEITKAVKKYARQPVIMKLGPTVTRIGEMAKAVEAGGADAVSLINTITGMKIDINRKSFVLANKTGGVSGPAIHPIAVRMVYEAANAVKVPVIGMGGISTAEDAIEMILAGASAVSVGTANFHNPGVTMEIVDGIAEYMERQGFKSIAEMVGIVK